jgi:hypothetical protein
MATILEQLACENPNESTLFAALVAPIRSIVGWSKHETLFFFAWIVLILIWLLLYFVVPLSFINTSNGFRSGFVTLISTVIIFAILVATYVLWARSIACDRKVQKAEYYVFGRRPAQPGYLTSAITRVKSLTENRGRSDTPWRPAMLN